MHRIFRHIREDAYPEALREIPDTPKRLYIEGALPEETVFLAVVGSRKMSAYGKRVCQQLIAGLSGAPVCIVSGLALGLDSVAHEASLSAGLPTVAVLPSGLSDSAIYPAAHRGLARHIVEAGGALISEYEPEERPRHWTFIARNRIVAGLCKATLVVEAPERSGALVTARLALDYNREVMAVPHPLGSETGAGTNALLRRGATLVRNAEDILDSLNLQPSTMILPSAPADLSPDEALLYDILSEAREKADLPELCALPQQRINAAISMLVIKGIVREELGKLVRN
jgi:DNA processing protein